MHLSRLRVQRGAVHIATDIGPVTAVIGPNYSGKTSILELISMALVGIPHSRRPSNQLAILEFEAHGSPSLTIQREGSYTPAQNFGDKAVTGHVLRVSEGGGTATRKIKDGEDMIAAHIGTGWRWDVEGLIAATAPERRKELTKIIGGDITVAAVRALLTERKAGSTQLPDIARPGVVGDLALLGKIPPTEGAVFADEWLTILRKAKTWLQAEAEKNAAAVDTSEARVKTAGAKPGSRDAWEEQLELRRAAVRELEATLSQIAATVAPRRGLEAAAKIALDALHAAREASIRDASAQIGAREAREAELAAAISTATAATATRDRLIFDRNRISADLDAVRVKLQAAKADLDVADKASRAEWAARVEAAEADANAVRVAWDVAGAALMDASRVERDAFYARLNAADAAVNTARLAAGDARSRREAAKLLAEDLTPVVTFVRDLHDDMLAGLTVFQSETRALLGARFTRDAATHAATLLLLLERTDRDPTAPSPEELEALAARTAVAATHPEVVEPPLLTALRIEIRATEVALNAARQNAAHFRSSPVPRNGELQSAVDALQEEVEALSIREQAAARASGKAITDSDAAAQRQIVASSYLERAKADFDLVCVARATALNSLPRLEMESRRAAQVVAELPSQSDAQIRTALETAKAEAASAEGMLARIASYEVLTKDRDDCALRAGQFAAARSELHQVEKRAERAIGELYASKMAPLVTPASEITMAVLGRRLTVAPDNAWSIGLDHRPVEQCSESETLVIGVALHCAVQRTTKGWRAVLLDRLEKVDELPSTTPPFHRSALVRALSAQVEAGHLDNAIFAAVEDGWVPPNAFVIRVDQLKPPTSIVPDLSTDIPASQPLALEEF